MARENRQHTARGRAVPSREGEAKPAQKRERVRRGAGHAAVVAVFTALLLAAQYALSFVKGVEIVTLLFAVFCYRFGVRCGVLSAVAFSLLRCFIFGFFPNVILLYLVYYPLFALAFGLLGSAFRRRMDGRIHLTLTVLSAVLTACFTLLDDALTPLVYGYTSEADLSYFMLSLPTMAVQTACAAVTMLVLFRPLFALFKKVKL